MCKEVNCKADMTEDRQVPKSVVGKLETRGAYDGVQSAFEGLGTKRADAVVHVQRLAGLRLRRS